MTIHELEARVKFGPLELGSKIGPEIPDKSVGNFYCIIHENKGESAFARFMYKVPLLNIPFAWWTEASHNFRARVIQPDQITLRASRDEFPGNSVPWCQDCNQQLVGEEINNHPLLSKRLRYIPD